MRGNITRRGKSSWRIKFDAGRDPLSGQRRYHVETVRGKRQDAEKVLTARLTAAEAGTLVEPSKVTIAEALRTWLSGATEITPKTRERYEQLAEQQIIPHLGAVAVQKLKPAQVQTWHGILLQRGGKDGKPLSARTVGHAHRVLHRMLERAVTAETISRNVAHAISPPTIKAAEVNALNAGQMAAVLEKLKGDALYPIVALALASGMRRGELLALRWQDLDFDQMTARVDRSLEETKSGLRFKAPKTRHGRRLISLPASTIETMRAHWKAQAETRLAIGAGRPEPDGLVFCRFDGEPLSPDNLSRDWRRKVKGRGLPDVMFHALRHSHASALIASGLDVLTVSRRLGHGNAVVTLNTYAHLFQKSDTAAAKAIEAALRSTPDR